MYAEDFAESIRRHSNPEKQPQTEWHDVTASKLFNDQFIAENTNFASTSDMLSKSGFENIDQFATNPPEKHFFATNTQFASFDEMVIAAKQVMAEQIFLNKHFGEST